MASTLSGILNLNKPAGISSAGALTRIKYLFPAEERPKIGHAGTLDPFATGVLLVLIGKATRLCESLMGQEKRYLATIKLGATTPTLDPTSPECPPAESEISNLKSADEIARRLAEKLPQFIGTIQQIPPAFSALKRDGKPLYKLARKGADVQLEARPVNVYAIDLLSIRPPFIQLDIRCGRGTYIRSLARDIAHAIGTKGYLAELCRSAVGAYTLDASIPLAGLTRELIAPRLQQSTPDQGR